MPNLAFLALPLVPLLPTLEQGSRPVLPFGPPAPPSAQEGWDITHYDIDLTLEPDVPQVVGVIDVFARARTDAPGPLLLHASDPTVSSITLDGATAPWTRSGDEILVETPSSTETDETVTFRVRYTAPGNTRQDLGLNWGEPTYSFSEPDGARRFLVVFDDPADKATLHWRITAPGEDVVAANGNPEGSVDNGDGTRTWGFDFPWPIATYLMVVNAGAFEVHVDEGGPVPVYTLATSRYFDRAVENLSNTKDMIQAFSDLWIPYPYDTYGNCLVPFSMYGAMENTTLTTFNQDYADAGGYEEIINAHELAHQWWGDWVTLADWKDIWLNEGMASYGDAQWVEVAYGEDVFRDYMRQYRDYYLASKDDEGVYTLYDPDVLFGVTVYYKGSSVLHMLRYVLGDDAFYEGLRTYADRHGGDVATTPDLQAAMENAAGTDLAWFFDQWVSTPDDPSYEVGLTETNLPDGTVQVDVHVRQTGPGLWTMPMPWVLTLDDGSTVSDVQWVSAEEQAWSYCLDQGARDLDVDPEGWLLYDGMERRDRTFSAMPDACSAGPDTGDTADTGSGPPPDDTSNEPSIPDSATPDDTGSAGMKPGGTCGCGLGAQGSVTPSCWLLALAAAWGGRRRRRARASMPRQAAMATP